MATEPTLDLPTITEGSELLTLTATPTAKGTEIEFSAHSAIVEFLGRISDQEVTSYRSHTDEDRVVALDGLDLRIWDLPAQSSSEALARRLSYYGRPNLRLDKRSIEEWHIQLSFLRFTVASPSRSLLLPVLDPDLWMPTDEDDPDSRPAFSAAVSKSILSLVANTGGYATSVLRASYRSEAI